MRQQRDTRHRSTLAPVRGFTLIETLVVLAVMALMALLSWRGLDGLSHVQARTAERVQSIHRAQTAAAQWRTDLDAAQGSAALPALDFDGRVLRLTRALADGGAGAGSLRVVAWGLLPARTPGAQGRVLARWLSGPLRNRADLDAAWQQAAQWGQGVDVRLREAETALLPLTDWQIVFHRGGSWSHALSEAGVADHADDATNPEVLPATADDEALEPPASTPALSGRNATRNAPPDGVRMVWQMPADALPSGRLVFDWARSAKGS